MDEKQDRSLKRTHIETYLSRYAHPNEYLSDHPVAENLNAVIAIPCFNETKLQNTLDALYRCHATRSPVEIIVLINQSEQSEPDIKKQNEATYETATDWAEKHSSETRRFHILHVKNIPRKFQGVGMSRKIVMDEAIRRLLKARNENGIIAGFDADCQCDPDYLEKIERYFIENPEANGGTVFFEHPLTEAVDDRQLVGIASYELHLRYLIHALRYTLFPYAFHTLGSCMVIKASIYAKQGGMNRRQAGEDFHFLHKIIPLGNFGDINTTKVIPSGRISHRVPFGTGRAMLKWDKSSSTEFNTYNPLIFEDLRLCLERISDLYSACQSGIEGYFEDLPSSFKNFIEKGIWAERIATFQDQSGSVLTFKDKFFQWMDALKVLQYIHYARDTGCHNVPVSEAYKWLNEKIRISDIPYKNVVDSLTALRNYDLNNPYFYKKT